MDMDMNMDHSPRLWLINGDLSSTINWSIVSLDCGRSDDYLMEVIFFFLGRVGWRNADNDYQIGYTRYPRFEKCNFAYWVENLIKCSKQGGGFFRPVRQQLMGNLLTPYVIHKELPSEKTRDHKSMLE